MAECNALASVIGSTSGMYNAAAGQYLHSSAYINGGDPSPPPRPPPLHPPLSDFINLIYDNHAMASPSNANQGNCAADYALGHFHTKLVWSKLTWLDFSQLRVNVTDLTYASLVAHPDDGVTGSGFMGKNAKAEFGYAKDCHGPYSTRGEAVVDLRGTPFAIDGVTDTTCDLSCSQKCSQACFQWTSSGWYPGITVTCTNAGQRCVVKCGGGGGRCYLTNGYLQLTWLDAPPPSLPPPPSVPISYTQPLPQLPVATTIPGWPGWQTDNSWPDKCKHLRVFPPHLSSYSPLPPPTTHTHLYICLHIPVARLRSIRSSRRRRQVQLRLLL